eukprot:Cvel_31115.t1-p1 / transcript=Cvel_31115.t1 / gene=Cvel_31115 / organism=Chromera_velia_CCMP2878 / gene_product=hypothetical protein / transcript_product=hypothetical protein / location=Cvel_scaffold4571:1-3849(-) / protein_length=939 / sequence_SO=supercontig / SO=protein_coding / is_pseudo=false
MRGTAALCFLLFLQRKAESSTLPPTDIGAGNTWTKDDSVKYNGVYSAYATSGSGSCPGTYRAFANEAWLGDSGCCGVSWNLNWEWGMAGAFDRVTGYAPAGLPAMWASGSYKKGTGSCCDDDVQLVLQTPCSFTMEKFTVKARNDHWHGSTQTASKMTVYGSTSLGSWTQIGQYDGVTWTQGGEQTFSVTPAGTYSYWMFSGNRVSQAADTWMSLSDIWIHPLEVDECTASSHNCDTNAACTDTTYSFTCACNSPYSGDGLVCLDIQWVFYNSDTDLPLFTLVEGGSVPFEIVQGIDINVEARVVGQYASLVESVRIRFTSPFTSRVRVGENIPYVLWGNSGTNILSGTTLQEGETVTLKADLYSGAGGTGSLLYTEDVEANATVTVVVTSLSIDYNALCGNGSTAALSANFEKAVADVEAWKSARLSEGADAETVQATADEEVKKINMYVLQVCIPQLTEPSEKEEAGKMVFETALINLKDQKSASTTSSEAMADIQTEGGNFLNHLNGITDLLAPVLSETGTEKVTFEVPGGGLTGTVGLVPSDGSPMEVESPSASVRIELPSPLGVGDPLGEQGGVGGYVNPWPEVRGAIPVVNRLSAPPRYILLLQSLVSPVPFAGERTREGGFVMGRMVGEFFRLASRESSRVVSQSRVPLFQPDRLGVQGERSTRRRRLGVSADEAGGSAGLMTLTVEYPKETAQTSLIESLELEFPQVVALKGGEWIRECAQLDVQNEIWTSAGCESPNLNADLSSAVCTCILRTLDTVIVLALRYIPPEKLTPTSVSNDGAILPDNNVENPFANGFQWLLTSSGLFMVMLLLAVARSEAQERADFPTLKIPKSSERKGKQLFGKKREKGAHGEEKEKNGDAAEAVESLAFAGIFEIIRDSLHFTRLKQHFNPRRVIAFRTARQKNKEEKGGEGKESGKQCCSSHCLVRVYR